MFCNNFNKFLSVWSIASNIFSTGTYSSPFCFEIFLASSRVTTNSFDALIPLEFPATEGILFNSFSIANFVPFRSNPAGANNNDAVSSSSMMPLNKCTGCNSWWFCIIAKTCAEFNISFDRSVNLFKSIQNIWLQFSIFQCGLIK